MAADITFNDGNALFRFRVAAVCLDRGRVLLQTGDEIDYWFLPGGRGQLLEPSEEALRREMREELGAEVRVERLLWVAENFFRLGAENYHEICFYYLVKFSDGATILKSDGIPTFEEGFEFSNRWHDLAGLDGLKLVPPFLKKALRALPDHPVHIVDWEEDSLPRFPGAPY